MQLEQASVRSQDVLTGGYRVLVLDAPGVAAAAGPGQFVHLRVPQLDSAVLRRPFSIFRAHDGAVHILYKCVGRGTAAMKALVPGDAVSLLGPLGRGFPACAAAATPVLVAGGYGAAPLCFLAGRLERRGVVLVGGATAGDVLAVEEFERLGWPVRVATEDGSRGRKGLVTGALDEWLAARPAGTVPEFYACGPHGMLRAVGERAIAGAWRAWLSVDRRMGCGVGACLACVVRVRDGDGAEKWARGCREGPVFEAREIVWDPAATKREAPG